MKPKAARSYEV